MSRLDSRVKALEQRTAAGEIGICWEIEGSRSLVEVNTTKERITVEEFNERYPNGTIIRVRWVEVDQPVAMTLTEQQSGIDGGIAPLMEEQTPQGWDRG